MGPRTGLDGRKISSPPGFDPGPSSPQSVAITTELPGPRGTFKYIKDFMYIFVRLTFSYIQDCTDPLIHPYTFNTV